MQAQSGASILKILADVLVLLVASYVIGAIYSKKRLSKKGFVLNVIFWLGLIGLGELFWTFIERR